MDISVRVIDHDTQRYETVGDWLPPDYTNVAIISVSRMNNEDYEFLVGIHEQIEMYLCHKRGIKEEDVSAFDIAFENERVPGNTDEPGNQVSAPYYKEHQFATKIEHQISDELGINWEEYDAAVNAL